MELTVSSEFIHYGTIALAIGIPSISVGIGEGIVGYAALKAINIQPKAHHDIINCAVIGTALIETVAIFGLCLSLLLLFLATDYQTIYGRYAELGIAAAIAISGFFIGIASALPARQTCMAIARQPFFATKLRNFMLLMQTIIQTPMIFCFIIAMLIKLKTGSLTTLNESLACIAAGLCIGIGSIGPAVGLAMYAANACTSIGINRKAYTSIFAFTIISQAIIETPIIFALVTALLIMYFNATAPLYGIAAIAAALCMAFGTMGPGLASGRTSASACTTIAHHPELYSVLSRTSMLAQGIIDTCAIYAFLLAMLILLSP
jgi:F0F1-type ATP synthase membrane subunit c/vacuolar-type H+-ATPase subunit K